MPLEWSGLLDLSGQIRCSLGFLLLAWLLWWPELLERKRSTVSFNKGGVCDGGGWRRGSCAFLLSMFCRGGEGRRERGVLLFFRRHLHRWRWFCFDVYIQARGISASAIHGRHGGPSSKPLDRRPCFILAAGARRFAATKWCIPDGFKASSGDGSTPERGVFGRSHLVPRW
jgi:hypothetical protein